MNNMIKKIEINLMNTVTHGQSIDIWIDPTDIDLIEYWREALDSIPGLEMLLYVDYRRDFINEDMPGAADCWKALPAPCVIFAWSRKGIEITEAVLSILRAEPEDEPTAEEIKTWWVK